MIFVDTGGWASVYNAADENHTAGSDWYGRNRMPLVTTDHVVDETLTLLRGRGLNHVAIDAGVDLLEADIADLIRVTPAEFDLAWEVFRAFRDKAWSFTDCTSYVVTQRRRIDTAFAFDQHFAQFGHLTIVPSAP